MTRSIALSRFAIPTGTQKSLNLDGVSDAAVSNIKLDTTGFSIGLWVKLSNDYTTDTPIVDWGSAGDRDGYRLKYDISSGVFVSVISDADSTEAVNFNTKYPSIGQWRFVCTTYVPNSSRIWVDGIGYAEDTSVTMTTNDNFVTLGKRSYADSFYASCKIKNLTIHNRTTVWTEEEINGLYKQNIIPEGAVQYQMNDNVSDNDNLNPLTLTGTDYSAEVPGHIGARISVI